MSDRADFIRITEIAGDLASREQINRIYQRYYWAGQYVRGGAVLEVACGCGHGLGYLSSVASAVYAGDVAEPVLAAARSHYGGRVPLARFDAQELPFAAKSFDAVVLFEALYYVPDASRFVSEAARVLRPGGHLLIVTANKDLFDFASSPFSVRYYGVAELGDLLTSAGFEATCFLGDTPIDSVPSRQRVLRPLKMLAAATRIMPKSKKMKAMVKRMVFGPMVRIPAEIEGGVECGPAPAPIPSGRPDMRHKVIFCAARRPTL
jgi:SAM-dependent methyltransferase